MYSLRGRDVTSFTLSVRYDPRSDVHVWCVYCLVNRGPMDRVNHACLHVRARVVDCRSGVSACLPVICYHVQT